MIEVTTGDPAGIGPEIFYKAIQSDKLKYTKIIVVGPVLDLSVKNTVDNVKMGKVSITGGKIAYNNIVKVVKFVQSRQVDAISTASINKELLKKSGILYIGHTEIFGVLTNTKNPLTTFETGNLRVFFYLDIFHLKTC